MKIFKAVFFQRDSITPAAIRGIRISWCPTMLKPLPLPRVGWFTTLVMDNAGSVHGNHGKHIFFIRSMIIGDIPVFMTWPLMAKQTCFLFFAARLMAFITYRRSLPARIDGRVLRKAENRWPFFHGVEKSLQSILLILSFME